MTKVMGRVVGECQHVFMEYRQNLDAVFIANEIVDELLHKNMEGVLSKLDMKKASL